MFSIRRTKYNDAALLPDIEQSADSAFLSIPHLAWVAQAGGHDVTSHLSFIFDAYSIVSVDDDDRPLGFLIARKYGCVLHLWALAVKRDWQGKGIGQALLNRLLKDACDENIDAVTLTTFRALRWNQYFYQKAGFHLIDDDNLDARLADILSAEEKQGFCRETRCAMQISVAQKPGIADGRITLMKLADAPQAAHVCAQWLFNEWGHRKSGNTLEASTQRFFQRLNRNVLPVAFVAMADNQVVGTASLVATEDEQTSVGPWVSGVFVSVTMRGQGIASRLIAIIEDEARNLGFSSLWLSAAVPEMYQKAGYQFTGDTKNGEPVMMKQLNPLN